MNVLVTGGAGFVGSHLVERLLAEGNFVTVLDNFSFGKEENKKHGADYILRDARDDLSDLGGYDVIFHLAALARIQPSFELPFETISVNMLGTSNVCHLAKRINAKVI